MDPACRSTLKIDPWHTRLRRTTRGLAEGSPIYAAETSQWPKCHRQVGCRCNPYTNWSSSLKTTTKQGLTTEYSPSPPSPTDREMKYIYAMSQWSFGNLQKSIFLMQGYFIKHFFCKSLLSSARVLKVLWNLSFSFFQNLTLDFPSNLAHSITCRTKPFWKQNIFPLLKTNSLVVEPIHNSPITVDTDYSNRF